MNEKISDCALKAGTLFGKGFFEESQSHAAEVAAGRRSRFDD